MSYSKFPFHIAGTVQPLFVLINVFYTGVSYEKVDVAFLRSTPRARWLQWRQLYEFSLLLVFLRFGRDRLTSFSGFLESCVGRCSRCRPCRRCQLVCGSKKVSTIGSRVTGGQILIRDTIWRSFQGRIMLVLFYCAPSFLLIITLLYLSKGMTWSFSNQGVSYSAPDH